jgi:hypothetical protein
MKEEQTGKKHCFFDARTVSFAVSTEVIKLSIHLAGIYIHIFLQTSLPACFRRSFSEGKPEMKQSLFHT